MSHKLEVVEEGLACIQSYIEIICHPEGFSLQLFPTSVLNGSEVLKVCDFSASALHFFPFEGGLVMFSEVISSLSPTSMMCQMRNLNWSCHTTWEDTQNGCH